MSALLIEKSRTNLSDGAFYETVIWLLPAPVPGSKHNYKYRLALVVNEVCVLRYDNERGKGDHRHIDDREEPIEFKDMETVVQAFYADMERIMK
ncbi:toxin-antitoxin system TumE family protein [Brucella thiophenivorans]|uniref:Uncharacterized protein n=1 Tax=Brucella thiophenivorans TaxID=571255 RepID=A0A256FTZ4_9HYPH|nr:DUF6516 family protein [Brucella thiophenivorans]OYR18220.1 hypothetical protein CEV31_4232 [Brucella thiophenivorans]